MTLSEKLLKIGKEHPRISVKNLGLLLALYDIGSGTPRELAKITGNSVPVMKEQISRSIERGFIEFFNVGQVRMYKLTMHTRKLLRTLDNEA